ncbi:MAG: hypothetical protein CM15mP116_06630 [Synechococcus sp.]|nr:MAG: hypothetical protein CM15mP116_06630 [Synechococcus sp.]
MHLAHPLGITAGQVIVHRHDVHATTSEGVEIARKGGNQGFAFASFHLGDLTFMQHHAANQLDIEMTHAQHTLAGFTNNGKGLRQDLVEDRPLVRQTAGIGQTLLEGSGFAT